MSGKAVLTLLRLSLFTDNGFQAPAPLECIMVGLATAMFVGLFAFGQQFLGWQKATNDEVQLGLFLAFILGIVCGYKTKG